MARRGGATFHSNLRAVTDAIDLEARKKVQAAANIARNEVLETLSGPRHGRRYRVPGTSRFYTASAPGEPPAQRTGRLRSSIRIEYSLDGLTAWVGSPLTYAIQLERGTRHMAPREFIRPAFTKVLPQIKATFGAFAPQTVTLREVAL